MTVTDSNGEYRFPRAQPGEYEMTARLQGFQPSTAGGVRVSLGEAMTVDFTMQEQFGEEIMVYSDTIGIDFTESQTRPASTSTRSTSCPAAGTSRTW